MKLYSLAILAVALLAGGLCQAADFSYSQNFTGDDDTLPADWTVVEGAASIQGNVLRTDPDETWVEVAYQGAGSEDWSNYTFSCDFLQTFTFSGLASNQSTLYNAILFRYLDAERYYMVRIRKLAGQVNPTLELTQRTPAGVYILGSAVMSQLLPPNTWHTLIIEADGPDLNIKLVETDYPEYPLAEITVEDTSYFKGTIAFRSIMSSPNYSEFDNVVVSGNTDLELTCATVFPGFGSDVDFNQDCYVDLIDLSIFAGNWLKCVDPEDPDCDQPWL